MAMAAVGLGIAASLQCQFLLVDLSTGTGWDLILDLLPDGVTSVWVGVFQWAPALDGNVIGECRTYDSFFGDTSEYYLGVAQGCAIAAPSKFWAMFSDYYSVLFQSILQRSDRIFSHWLHWRHHFLLRVDLLQFLCFLHIRFYLPLCCIGCADGSLWHVCFTGMVLRFRYRRVLRKPH
jgi:hypothetical protein